MVGEGGRVRTVLFSARLGLFWPSCVDLLSGSIFKEIYLWEIYFQRDRGNPSHENYKTEQNNPSHEKYNNAKTFPVQQRQNISILSDWAMDELSVPPGLGRSYFGQLSWFCFRSHLELRPWASWGFGGAILSHQSIVLHASQFTLPLKRITIISEICAKIIQTQEIKPKVLHNWSQMCFSASDDSAQTYFEQSYILKLVKILKKLRDLLWHLTK